MVAAGLIINYLARNTLSVAAPTLMKDLNITTVQYAHVVVAWQLCYAFMQPVAGYVLDTVGTKLGFAVFALAWSLACAAAAWSTGWRSLAFFRGVLGIAEAAGIPAGVKATSEWFPAKERSVAIGWFNIGSSIGALLAPPLVVWALLHGQWQWAFLIVGVAGIVWSALWMLLYKHPQKQKLLSDTERDYILSGQEAKHSEAGAAKRSWASMLGSRDFWAIGIPRILSEPAWQTFNAWIPLYMMTERHMNLKEVALYAWMPFLAADIGCVLGGYLSPLFHKYAKVSLFTSRKLVFVVGALCMIGPACVGAGGESLRGRCAAVRRRLCPSDAVGCAVRDHLRHVRQERSRHRHGHGRHGWLPGRRRRSRRCSACWSRRSAIARCLWCSRCSTSSRLLWCACWPAAATGQSTRAGRRRVLRPSK